MFQFKTDALRVQYEDFIASTTGKEPCYDPKTFRTNRSGFQGEAVADLYVENWTGRNISRKTAEELCAGCPVYDKCKAYAIAAKEPYGIWGGTRPQDRGIKPRYRG